MNKKAFTLIELLVVVLIIGILAAIALPQYTKAVEKSRLAEALTLGRSVQLSFDRCIMAGNTCAECGKMANLDIEIPYKSLDEEYDNYFAGKHFNLALPEGDCSMLPLYRNNSDWNIIFHTSLSTLYPPGTIRCGYDISAEALKMCQSIGKQDDKGNYILR
ncbi:type IV pilus assembly protein PilE [Elusimicrobium posterum]|uniref:pilin n=1 Tax=Elusimicrobium posterum TaxID=3116653 RepID=UPI003C773A65